MSDKLSEGEFAEIRPRDERLGALTPESALPHVDESSLAECWAFLDRRALLEDRIAIAADNERLTRELGEYQQRLAALAVDGEDAEALAEIARRTWAIPGTSLDHVAAAVAARVRTPLLQQIEELKDKVHRRELVLTEGEEQITELTKRLNDSRSEVGSLRHELGFVQGENAEMRRRKHRARIRELEGQIAELTAKLEAAKGLVDASGQIRKRMQQDRDRLAAELSTTKQALADARGDVAEKAKEIYRRLHPGQCKIVSKGWSCRCFLCQLDNAIAAPTQPAASDPADHSGDANEKVEPAERRFVCPKCGGHENGTTPVNIYCTNIRCDWRGTWAEVEAAKGEQGLPIVADDPSEVKVVKLTGSSALVVENNKLKQQIEAERQAREAAEQRANKAEATVKAIGLCNQPLGELSIHRAGDKTFEQHLNDWMKANSAGGNLDRFYHGIFPLGMVGGWIDRAIRAEQRAERAEAAVGATVEWH